MKSAAELLNEYLSNVREPAKAAAVFAPDGVLELPTVQAHAQGPAAIQKLVEGLLEKVPDFRFEAITFFIDAGDKAFAEYSVEARVTSTGKIYKQTYAGVCVAENGKIKLLREALDTLAASKAFSKD